MSDRKGTTVLLTVIGIATLLVTLVGATFAWFSARVDDKDTGTNNVVITAANLGKVTFTHGNTITLENVYPGAKQEVEFEVSSDANATAPVDYEIFMIVDDNTFTTDNLLATLSGVSGNTTGMVTKLTSTALNTTSYPVNNTIDANNDTEIDGVLIGSGQVQAKATDKWLLNVTLDEADSDQWDDQGKSFKATLVVRTTNQYTQSSVYGTATN